jgi:peptidoglycan/LPS O-acetylase OafA/YrhL
MGAASGAVDRKLEEGRVSMGIGSGVLLLALGAVLTWAVDFDLPYIADDTLGLILLLAGVAVLVGSVIMQADRPEAGVGTGIMLIVVGAIITFAVAFDVPYIDDDALGAIFMVGGVIAVIGTVAMATQRRRNYDDNRGDYYRRDDRPLPDRY